MTVMFQITHNHIFQNIFPSNPTKTAPATGLLCLWQLIQVLLSLFYFEECGSQALYIKNMTMKSVIFQRLRWWNTSYIAGETRVGSRLGLVGWAWGSTSAWCLASAMMPRIYRSWVNQLSNLIRITEQGGQIIRPIVGDEFLDGQCSDKSFFAIYMVITHTFSSSKGS